MHWGRSSRSCLETAVTPGCYVSSSVLVHGFRLFLQEKQWGTFKRSSYNTKLNRWPDIDDISTSSSIPPIIPFSVEMEA
jgi:hypothetical protein